MCNDPKPLTSTTLRPLQKILNRGYLNADATKYFMMKDPTCASFYLHDVPGRPVISNCGYYTEETSFLDFHLERLAREVKSYINDTNDFLKKLRVVIYRPT